MHGLILDDSTTTDLQIVTEAARALGHDVAAVSDPRAFFDEQKSAIPAFQIVDHKLDNAEDSVALKDGPEVVALSAAKLGPIRTLFLTNFPPNCHDKIDTLDPRLVSCVVPKPTASSVSEWIEPIREALSNLLLKHPSTKPLGFRPDRLRTRFFDLPAAELVRCRKTRATISRPRPRSSCTRSFTISGPRATPIG